MNLDCLKFDRIALKNSLENEMSRKFLLSKDLDDVDLIDVFQNNLKYVFIK